jgi:predicted outer membrane protein
MTEAETTHIEKTMMVGGLALLTSRVAQQKAHGEQVKNYAQFEVAEQETIVDILGSMKEPGKFSPFVRLPSDEQVEGTLDQDGKATLARLRNASGRFDTAYIAAHIDGHRKLLELQKNCLDSSKNVAAIYVASL